MRHLRITGTATSLPKTKISADQLEKRLNLQAGSIQRRSGVATRYFIENESAVDLAVDAIQRAMQTAGIEAHELDALVCASASFFQTLPSNAVVLHHRLKFGENVATFDVDATCLSFVTALDLVSDALNAQRYRHVVIVSCETPSKIINWDDEETATLFGDGASAVVVSSVEPGTSAVLHSLTRTYGEGIDLCRVYGGGSELPWYSYQSAQHHLHYFEMNGPKVFRLASQHMVRFVEDLLAPSGLSVSQLQMVIPHQASLLAIQLLQRKLGISDHQIMITLPDVGNTVAASIPMALHQAIVTGRLHRGAKVMFLGTSAGVAIGGMVLEY